MNDNYSRLPARNMPSEQRNALQMELHHYGEMLRSLGDDARKVVYAHQIFFPRSSATGVQTLASAIRKKFGPIAFHDLGEYHGQICNDVARTLIEGSEGFALLLAGTLEDYTQ